MALQQNSFYNSLIKQDIYHSIDEEAILDKQRFALFRIFSLTGAVASIGVFIKMCFMFEELHAMHYVLPALSAIILFNFYRIQKTSQLPAAYFMLILSTFILLHIVSYVTGGIRSASVLFIPVVILYAFMLLGKKMGQFFTVLFACHIVFIFFISRYTDYTSFAFLNSNKNHIEEDFLFNAIFVFLLLATHGRYVNSGRNIIIKKITQQRDELARKNLLMQQTNLNLERVNAELDKFAYVVSHDLKAPLRAIGNLSSWVEEDMNSGNKSEAMNNLATIKSRANRMEDLINGILAYSKAGKNKEDVVAINIESLLRESVDMLNATAFTEINIGENVCEITGSRAKFLQLFLNIISNAIKHADNSEVKISVDVLAENDSCHFIFRDNGPGIDPQYHERIFVIFQTLKSRDEFESVGVGLAIVKRIVDDEGGKIWIESKAGEGAAFHITFPNAVVNTPKKAVSNKVQG